ncbi:MAG: hypothetical protein U0Y82_10735 [Thermoleophilia bacterium]
MICGPGGVPHAVIVPGGRRRSVMQVRDEWLVQDRWWTDQPVERHFFELLLEPGRVVVTYQELTTREWFAYL